MNKIKDILYNKSDILIAILILAIAALIIFWRLGVILEYPKEVIGTNDTDNVLTDPTEEDSTDQGEAGDQEQGESTDTETGDDQQDTNTDTDTDTGDTDTDNDADADTDDNDADADKEDDTEDTSAPATKASWDGDKLKEDLEVTITGTTASAAVQCMVEAGIYENYAEYQKICQDNGMDHEKMRAGVFKFEKGISKLEITKRVNWTNY